MSSMAKALTANIDSLTRGEYVRAMKQYFSLYQGLYDPNYVFAQYADILSGSIIATSTIGRAKIFYFYSQRKMI